MVSFVSLLEGLLILNFIDLSSAGYIPLPFKCDYNSTNSVDVAVLGGGASGTYAAVRLHRQNRTIALIEQEERLGGQVNTYLDTETGTTVEYGVNQYTHTDAAIQLFEYLKVPYVRGTASSRQSATYFDFNTGGNFYKKNKSMSSEALETYQGQLARYPYLEDGFFLPDPIPEDLLLPFGNFSRKFGIEHSVASLSVGMGDVLSLPTIYVMKHYGSAIFQNKFIFTVHKNNQEIYDRAKELLEPGVFLSSKSHRIQRNGDGDVRLCLETPTGTHLVHAKRLIMAVPPTLESLQNTGIDLGPEEETLLSNFSQTGYYTSLVRIPGLANDLSPLENADRNDTIFGLTKLPGIWRILQTAIPDLYIVEYGSKAVLSDDVVQRQMLTDLARLRDAGLISVKEEPQIVRFSNHSPFYPYVGAKSIRRGFYQQLYALQGRRNTFWTGSAFHVPDSSLLWRFTESLLSEVTAGLH
ncbi:FAD/NAD(P)-binding domain-containing protein [Aspergillus tamarii]|uniref:FAD/NAD(P)-binding domain-containing protein n=1 Tax=Aspergillus tamarii TaxID=41984 RepID=A0A5N6UGX3_ASPTM|nr:FAD/NAD(P)-binding domain-containing protein [Aspergillus tamarii]